MIDTKNIIYAKLNLPFPKDQFIHEYDSVILPNSIPLVSGKGTWFRTRDINKHWGMVSEEIYDKTDVLELDGTITKRGYSNWDGTSLIYLDTSNNQLKQASIHGSVSVRNNIMDRENYKFKEEYTNLSIVNFIRSLPLKDIIGVRCVSLSPNSFASIHKDSMNSSSLDKSSIEQNQLWNNGFISITLNLTNGGQPLFFSDEVSPLVPITVNDECYLFNDYFWHGVPLVKTRRRQIRITARPLDDFYNLIDKKSIIKTDV
jgi:hypothetical protein